MDPELAIRRYGDFMRRIKYRTEVVRRCETIYQRGSSVTGYRETDIGLCYLQLRKSLELMMFASLIAHDTFGRELDKKLRDKEWRAGKIVKQLERVNPRFYPAPVNHATPRSGADILTKTDFQSLYGRCGDMLHAKREDVYGDRIPSHFREVREYCTKLVRLLNHHWVHITDDIALVVLMPTQPDGDVQVEELKKLSLKQKKANGGLDL